MTVEPDVVRRKLLEINEATGHLRSWTPITIERLETDQQLRWAVERGRFGRPSGTGVRGHATDRPHHLSDAPRPTTARIAVTAVWR
jgi:hypothetical protein